MLPTTDIERGRADHAERVRRRPSVAILGWDTADRLFGTIDPIDKMITIAGVHFRVVGVAAKKGAIFGQSQDEFAVVPLERLPARVRIASVAAAHGRADATRRWSRRRWTTRRVALRIERRLRPREPDNFGVVSSDTFLNIYNQATSVIFAVLIGVVGLSLVVGGIVIMNIMLMVVSERTREIGLRKSLGARRRDILWQILTESVTLSDVRRHGRHRPRLPRRPGSSARSSPAAGHRRGRGRSCWASR